MGEDHKLEGKVVEALGASLSAINDTQDAIWQAEKKVLNAPDIDPEGRKLILEELTKARLELKMLENSVFNKNKFGESEGKS